MALTKGFIRNAATTPLDARLMDMAKIAANADGSPRAGVLTPTPTIVTTKATMHVAVAAAEFVTSKGKADGVAIFTNDGSVDVAIDVAPASNSRIDVIYVKHNDDTTGDASALPVFGVEKGIAAPAPTKPAIPTGALELATLQIYAGTTATNGGSNVLTNTYQMTAMRGGVVLFRTGIERNAWTTATDGQLAVDLATNDLSQWDGAKWVVVYGDTDWIVPTLSSGWTSTTFVAYRRRSGIVFFRGRLSGGATGVAFTLPAGFRTASGMIYGVQSGTGSPPTMARVTVLNSGAFELVSGTEPNIGAISYIADL